MDPQETYHVPAVKGVLHLLVPETNHCKSVGLLPTPYFNCYKSYHVSDVYHGRIQGTNLGEMAFEEHDLMLQGRVWRVCVRALDREVVVAAPS
jgi:hypothetical protein